MNTTVLIRSLALPVVLSAFLGGCYIPIRFDAEIEIHRTGHYDFIFDGYLASVELYKGLREGKISPAEAHARATIAKQIWNGARIYLQAIKTIQGAAKPVAKITEGDE